MEVSTLISQIKNKRKSKRKTLKAKWTRQMLDNLEFHHGIDTTKELEEMLVNELKKFVGVGKWEF